MRKRSGADDPDAKPADLDSRRQALGDLLEGARKRNDPPPESTARGSALGTAFKVATEFLAGLLVGGGMGWYLDKWLGTGPFLFLLFFALGAAAGMLNVIRHAIRMNRDVQDEIAKSNGEHRHEAGRRSRS